MIIAHLADIHIGHRQYGLDQRAEDYARTFKKAVDKLLEIHEDKHIDVVVISGDLFDNAKPSPISYLQAIDCLRRIREVGIPIIAIRGNHEASVVNPTENPLNVLASMNLIKYLERGCIKLDKVLFIGHGCIYTEHQNKLYAYLMNTVSSNDINIILLHQYIEGTPYTYPMPNIDYYTISSKIVKSLMDGRDCIFLCGHIHDFNLRHPQYPVLYPGSLEIWDSKEFETYTYENGKFVKIKDMSDKGFLIIDIDESTGKFKVKPIKIEPSRRMIKLELKYDTIDPMKFKRDMIDIIEKFDIPNAYVQIEVSGKLERGYTSRDLQCSQFRRMFKNVLKVDFKLDISREVSSPKSGSSVRTGTYYGIDTIIKRAIREVLKNDPDVEIIENIILELLDSVERGDKYSVVKIFEKVLNIQLKQEGDIRSLLF